MKAQELLKAHGIKITKFRLHIIQTLNNAKVPLSYDEFLSGISENKTTFYRNIDILEKCGIVTKTENNHRSYYELAEHAKAYFICDMCHKMESMQMPIFKENKNVKSVFVKGICDECSEK